MIENRDHGFLAFLGHGRELDLAFMDIEDRVSRISLRKDNLLLGERERSFSLADFFEKGLGIESWGCLRAIGRPPLKCGVEPPERTDLTRMIILRKKVGVVNQEATTRTVLEEGRLR